MKTKAVHEYEDCKLAGRCKKQRQWNMGGKGRNQGLFFFWLNTCKARTGLRNDKTSGIHKRQHLVFPKYSLTYRFAQLHSRMFSFSIRKHEKLPSRMNLQKTLALCAQKAAVSVTGLATSTRTARQAFLRKIRPLRPPPALPPAWPEPPASPRARPRRAAPRKATASPHGAPARSAPRGKALPRPAGQLPHRRRRGAAPKGQ